MKLSYNWLNDYVDLSKIAISEIAEGLSLSTCEIESFYESFAYLDRIQLARALSVEKHPDADRLKVCRVRSGAGELQIVCGAENVHSGMLAALAPVGAKLPLREKAEELKENRESFWEVRKAKIRGVESSGMLCSAEELGLEKILSYPKGREKSQDKTKGIIDLEKDFGNPPPTEAKRDAKENSLLEVELSSLKIGTPMAQIFPLRDFIFDVDNKSITHRPDLWSHFGFARELSAIFHLPLKFDPLGLKPAMIEKDLSTKIINVKKNAALAYYGISLGGVQIQASPLWMQARLINIGHSPVNNVVDTSNYVMYDMGQPNHAFDSSELKEKSISVLLNGDGLEVDSFTTLDGEERKLPSQSILILDGEPQKKCVVALGGLMGGLGSRVQNDTKELFVESATFPRERIRRMISALALRTDSAQRFEKGQDPLQAAPALYRFAQLLKQSCPKLKIGRISGKVYAGVKQKQISTSLEFIQSRLGFAISISRVQEILESLGFTVDVEGLRASAKKTKGAKKKTTEKKDINLTITIPSYRSQYDVGIAEDIVEELGRIHRYDNIEAQSPPISLTASLPNSKMQLLRQVREYFAYGMNFNESYNYSFSAEKRNALFLDKKRIALKNPVFDHKRELRLSLLPGLLEQAAMNQDRFSEARLFEVGQVYWEEAKNKSEEIREESRLACVFLGARQTNFSSSKKMEEASLSMQGPLLYMRQKIEALFHRFLGNNFCSIQGSRASEGLDKSTIQNYTLPLHPRASLLFLSEPAQKERKVLAGLGVLHPIWERHFDIKRPALILDLDFEVFFDLYSQRNKQPLPYEKPSVYPDSYFEISLLLPAHTGSHIPAEIIKEMGLAEIKSVRYLTEYQGPPLSSEQKSVSYQIACSSPNRTLKGEEAQALLDKLVARLKEVGFPLRS